jgi:hypothetical protein
MQDSEILEVLLELARDAGLVVRIGSGSSGVGDETPLASGVCRVRDEVWVVLSISEPAVGQIQVLAGALKKYAGTLLEERFLPPAVRAWVDPGGDLEAS